MSNFSDFFMDLEMRPAFDTAAHIEAIKEAGLIKRVRCCILPKKCAYSNKSLWFKEAVVISFLHDEKYLGFPPISYYYDAEEFTRLSLLK